MIVQHYFLDKCIGELCARPNIISHRTHSQNSFDVIEKGKSNFLPGV